MTEDEREELVYKLCAEFQASIGSALNAEKTYAFLAGARAALHAVEQKADTK